MRILIPFLSVLSAACSSAPTTVAKKVAASDPCLGIQAPGDYELHADWADLFTAVEPDLDPRDACYDDAGEEVACVYDSIFDFVATGTQGAHHLVVEAPNGFHLYRELVPAPSGGFCGWQPISMSTSHGPFKVIAASAEHFFYGENTCQSMGEYAVFAILDATSLALIATFSCEAEATPTVTLEGQRLRFDGCRQGTASFSRSELSACAAR